MDANNRMVDFVPLSAGSEDYEETRMAISPDQCAPVTLPFASETFSPEIVEGEILLVQLPSLFPTLVMPKASPKKRVVPKKGTPFAELPDGRIGTLKVHKSGKQVLHVGDVQFLVSQGHESNYFSQVACVAEDEIVFLGHSAKRLVVSPSIT